jgi:hypothetical protein
VPRLTNFFSFYGEHTTTDRLALTLTGAAGAVAAVAIGKKKTGTGRKENWRNSISFLLVYNLLSVFILVDYIPPCFMGKPG